MCAGGPRCKRGLLGNTTPIGVFKRDEFIEWLGARLGEDGDARQFFNTGGINDITAITGTRFMAAQAF